MSEWTSRVRVPGKCGSGQSPPLPKQEVLNRVRIPVSPRQERLTDSVGDGGAASDVSPLRRRECSPEKRGRTLGSPVIVRVRNNSPSTKKRMQEEAKRKTVDAGLQPLSKEERPSVRADSGEKLKTRTRGKVALLPAPSLQSSQVTASTSSLIDLARSGTGDNNTFAPNQNASSTCTHEATRRVAASMSAPSADIVDARCGNPDDGSRFLCATRSVSSPDNKRDSILDKIMSSIGCIESEYRAISMLEDEVEPVELNQELLQSLLSTCKIVRIKPPLRPEQIPTLTSALRASTCLQNLSLRDVSLSDSALSMLLLVLQNHPSVTSLDLRGMKVGPVSMTMLERSLRSCYRLQHVRLDDTNGSKVEDIRALAKENLAYRYFACGEVSALKLTKRAMTSFTPSSAWVNTRCLAVDFSANLLQRVPTVVTEDLPFITPWRFTLQELHLSHNRLSRLPDLSHMQALVRVNVSHNSLTELPSTLFSCSKLQYLDVSSNVVRDLPHQMCDLEMLDTLDISNNRITEIDMSIIEWWYKNVILSPLETCMTKLRAWYDKEVVPMVYSATTDRASKGESIDLIKKRVSIEVRRKEMNRRTMMIDAGSMGLSEMMGVPATRSPRKESFTDDHPDWRKRSMSHESLPAPESSRPSSFLTIDDTPVAFSLSIGEKKEDNTLAHILNEDTPIDTANAKRNISPSLQHAGEGDETAFVDFVDAEGRVSVFSLKPEEKIESDVWRRATKKMFRARTRCSMMFPVIAAVGMARSDLTVSDSFKIKPLGKTIAFAQVNLGAKVVLPGKRKRTWKGTMDKCLAPFPTVYVSALRMRANRATTQFMSTLKSVEDPLPYRKIRQSGIYAYGTSEMASENVVLTHGEFVKQLEPKQSSGLTCLCAVNIHAEVWVGSENGSVFMWDMKTAEYLGQRKFHKSAVTAILVVDKRVWVASRDNTISVWPLEGPPSPVPAHHLLGHTKEVTCLCSKGRRVWSGGLDGKIRVWDQENGKCVRVWKLHKLQISVMRRVSNTVWVGGDNNIHIVGAKSGKTQTILGGHHGMILSMFVCDNTVWTSAEDNTIRVWNADMRTCDYVVKTTGPMFCLFGAWSCVWSGGGNRRITVWDAKTVSKLATLEKRHRHDINDLIYINVRSVADDSAEDHPRVWSCSKDGTVVQWKLDLLPEHRELSVM